MTKYTPVDYEQFDVIISSVCPKCKSKIKTKVNAEMVYWLQEATVDLTCIKCNNELRLRSMND